MAGRALLLLLLLLLLDDFLGCGEEEEEDPPPRFAADTAGELGKILRSYSGGDRRQREPLPVAVAASPHERCPFTWQHPS